MNYLEIRSLQFITMRSQGVRWTLNPYEEKTWAQTEMHRRKIKWKDRNKIVTYKLRRVWRQVLPLHTSEGTNCADTLILDFQLTELWVNESLLLEPPRVGYFVMAGLANWCGIELDKHSSRYREHNRAGQRCSMHKRRNRIHYTGKQKHVLMSVITEEWSNGTGKCERSSTEEMTFNLEFKG